ncbi:MAG: CyCJ cytochrome-c biosynthesis protein [Hyphomicrobiales bacterium]|nr:CyCJ cytochrome-c biosynthesis protein [Hyphomicrobiales bacterium]
MTRKQRRLTLILSALAVIGVALGLVLYAMRDNIVFFYTPGEIVAKDVKPGTRLRLGGLVKEGSVEKGADRSVLFTVADAQSEMRVRYSGVLPDLFREGQGVVAEGVFEGAKAFRADTVLAKHDETYMPREVADSLKKQGHWQPGGPPAAPAAK